MLSAPKSFHVAEDLAALSCIVQRGREKAANVRAMGAAPNRSMKPGFISGIFFVRGKTFHRVQVKKRKPLPRRKLWKTSNKLEAMGCADAFKVKMEAPR